jgi:hypothetical protein
MKTNIYNKDKKLSYYGLSCGYVERKENEKSWKEIYKEHNHFHVRKGKHNEKFEVWETFDNNELTKARKLFNSLKLN